MQDTYTHKDLARLCLVSETTIKSYRRKFPGFIPVLTRGKPIRFKKEAGDVCLAIRDCFEKGMSVRETRKTLKENFAEHPTAPQKSAQRTPSAPHSVVSEEYLEKFFATAGQMMQGMASLATAQAKAGQRLQKLEDAVARLVEIETRNTEMFSELLSANSQQPRPQSATAQTPEPKPTEQKMRARKIVNVTDREGEVKSYAIEKDTTEMPANMERPSDAFLETPIVIMNDQGEFLGVPGRLSLAGFLEILLHEAEEAGDSQAFWKRENETWIFTMVAPDGDTHALYFMSTTTPRGNLVVLLDGLDVNNKQTSPHFLQEFFRQVKSKI
ncbi:MerR family transcriptional regulator [Pseudodesulfovibrio piezophilus]|uniref:HTH merR-type domain-containing protein n=1 Tax=Pseudodesulfovibrio piezophilus (strain DSM 21447 / JCM 15486 / C1TLV30) TaxID=1322246 RepID=M1WT90_PSEP2|nr:MerR family transcriptional regulator [Pseudodesulfovibrio piezophilus]CCH49352.1 conserved protein of unknown function [Pseudodesulfovibrio piezophilus C1TLV30]